METFLLGEIVKLYSFVSKVTTKIQPLRNNVYLEI